MPAIATAKLTGATHLGRLMQTVATPRRWDTPGAEHTFVGWPPVSSQIAAVSMLAAASTCFAIGLERIRERGCDLLPRLALQDIGWIARATDHEPVP